ALNQLEIIEPLPGDYNLPDYSEVRKNFKWEDAGTDLSFIETGKLNIAYEMIDRHVDDGYGSKTALHYVNGYERANYTFTEVKERTDHYARILKENGVVKGDRVFIFLPKTPECYIAILSVIKIGAVAGPLFEAFMEDAVRDRINDCGGTLLITDKEMVHRVPASDIPTLETILFAEDIEAEPFQDSGEEYVEWMNAEDSMLIHYTSGS